MRRPAPQSESLLVTNHILQYRIFLENYESYRKTDFTVELGIEIDIMWPGILEWSCKMQKMILYRQVAILWILNYKGKLHKITVFQFFHFFEFPQFRSYLDSKHTDG